MPGYEVDLSKSAVEEQLFCPKCHLVLRMPYQSMCGHRYCFSCIDEMRRPDKSFICVVDGEVSSAKDKRDIDAIVIDRSIQNFVSAVERERSCIPSYVQLGELPNKRARLDDPERARILNEVCYVLIFQCRTSFKFSGHLIAATPFDSQNFEKFALAFPTAILKRTVEGYPMLDEIKLQSELTVLYGRMEFRDCCGALALFKVLKENNLHFTLTETSKLLNILIFTPMTSSEPERCFSTLKRIKTFLRNTMQDSRLSALAMLSIEKGLTRSIPTFNADVVQRFAHQKDRRATFLYK